jgi:UDPglucose--hexose-1-phosphate uridylyltransferase
MPEFRQDIITGNWVIVAKERARRPEDFSEPEKPPRSITVRTVRFVSGMRGKRRPRFMLSGEMVHSPTSPGGK